MNEEKIAELTEKAKKLQGQLLAIAEAEVAKFTTFAQGLTTEKIYVRWNAWSGWGFEVGLLNEKTGYSVFGTEIDVRADSTCARVLDNGEPTRVTLNTGSSGSFGQEDAGQVFKYSLMAKFIENFGVLNEMLADYLNRTRQLNKEHEETRYEAERLIRENERAEEEAKIAEALAMLKDGSWVSNGKFAYQVVRITEKMVFYKYWWFSTPWDFATNKPSDKGEWRRDTPSYKNATLYKKDLLNLVASGGYTIGEVPEGVNIG